MQNKEKETYNKTIENLKKQLNELNNKLNEKNLENNYEDNNKITNNKLLSQIQDYETKLRKLKSKIKKSNW